MIDKVEEKIAAIFECENPRAMLREIEGLAARETGQMMNKAAIGVIELCHAMKEGICAPEDAPAQSYLSGVIRGARIASLAAAGMALRGEVARLDAEARSQEPEADDLRLG